MRAYKVAMTPPMMPVLLVLDGGLQEDPISDEVKERLRIPKLTLASPPQADSGAAPTGPVARAGMRNLAFVPGTITIQAGTTVEWTNNDPLSHSVTSDDGSFASGLIGSGRKWRHTFATPGTYTYHCTPHPFMKGTVIVR